MHGSLYATQLCAELILRGVYYSDELSRLPKLENIYIIF